MQPSGNPLQVSAKYITRVGKSAASHRHVRCRVWQVHCKSRQVLLQKVRQVQCRPPQVRLPGLWYYRLQASPQSPAANPQHLHSRLSPEWLIFKSPCGPFSFLANPSPLPFAAFCGENPFFCGHPQTHIKPPTTGPQVQFPWFKKS